MKIMSTADTTEIIHRIYEKQGISAEDVQLLQIALIKEEIIPEYCEIRHASWSDEIRILDTRYFDTVFSENATIARYNTETILGIVEDCNRIFRSKTPRERFEEVLAEVNG